MADAVFAGHEDHRHRIDAGDLHGVVTGAGFHVAVAEFQLLTCAAHHLDQFRREGRRRNVLDLDQLDVHALLVALVGGVMLEAQRLELVVHLGEHCRFQVTQVDAEAHLARNHVARVGMHIEFAAGDATVGLVGIGQRQDVADQRAGGLERIAAVGHRRRAGVGFLTADHHVEPVQTQRAGDGTDGDLFLLQHRALLDMRLEIGAEIMAAHRHVTSIAGARQ